MEDVGADWVAKSQPADVYSLGMTILEILTGRPPYDELRRAESVVIAVQRGKFPNRPPEISTGNFNANQTRGRAMGLSAEVLPSKARIQTNCP